MIRDEFTVHMLNDLGKEKATKLAILFSEFLSKVETVAGCACGREMVEVRTHLQVASYWAKRAMAKREEHHQQQ